MARRSLGLFALPILSLLAGCTLAPENVTEPEDTAPSDAVPVPTTAAASDVTSPAIQEKWFVELKQPSLARGGDPVLLHAEKKHLRASISAARIPVLERYAFDRLWNGISVHADSRSAAEILALPDVKAIYPVVPVEMDKTSPPIVINAPVPVNQSTASSPDLATAITMTGADIAQNTLGLTGAKVRVGVIDSGIDINHPDLGGTPQGCFGPGCRVAFGYDFVGDNYDSSTGGAYPVPDAIPDDCGGHGSHVAGIIGANGAVKGVAPNVIFGAYRVFGCGGTTDTDIMLKAMEMASTDGMRVVNMSIGSSFQWPGYPSAVAADQLVADGVVVVCSHGNSGATSGLGPISAGGAPGVGRDVIGTASIDNTYTTQPAFTLSNATKIGFNPGTGAPIPPGSGTLNFVTFGSPTATNDMCNSAANLPAAGSLSATSVVLIRRGGCTFYEKSANAQAAGAGAAVLYNNTTGQLSPTVAGATTINVPVVAITAADGATIYNNIQAGSETLTWGYQTISSVNPTGGTVSYFSSWGLAHDLSLKPDLAAPGGSIYSTVPLELGAYASYSGTSMASPHVAGAAALLLEQRPELTPKMIRDLLQNTAVPVTWSGDASMATADPVPRQGAGMIHVDVAAQAPVIISPGKLSLGESQAGPSTQTVTLQNLTGTAITYDVTHMAAAETDAAYWTPTLNNTNPATVSFSAQSVTVPANGTAQLTATITANAGLVNGGLYSGFLVFTPQGGGTTLHVPYAGFKGDYQALPMLTAGGTSNYPWLARYTGSFTKQSAGATFTLQSGDLPYVVFHLDRPARRITLDLYDAVKGKPYGNVVDSEYFGMNSSATGAFNFYFNGYTVFNKQTYKVPNGSYVLKLRALKALGDANNPADWETWTSPAFTLNHP